MRGPFDRRCANVDKKTKQECLGLVSSSIAESGHETLWCEHGHKVKEWFVTDADGAKMALAKLNSSPQILDAEMLEKLSIDPIFSRIMRPPVPTQPCKRGHTDWLLYADEKYRCRQCKKDAYDRDKHKFHARYLKRRAELRATPEYIAKHKARLVRKAELIAQAVLKKKSKKKTRKGKKKNVR